MFASNVLAAAIAAISVLCMTNLQAATVVEELPYAGTPDWTDIVGGGTSMNLIDGGTASLLSTANNTAVWFGWGPAASYGPQPSWSPGSNVDGNYVRLEASFSAGAADWSMYLHDLTSSMGWSFAPTGCDGNAGSCYAEDGDPGVQLSHPGGGTFVALDLTTRHTFEVLLKDGLVAYWIDGTRHYAGPAGNSTLGFPLLVIGDGSGTTRTGRGSMTVHAIALDNAPLASVVVPLPAGLPLLGGALLLLGGMRREPGARLQAARLRRVNRPG